MTKERLAEIKAREKAATKGPWQMWAGWMQWSKDNDTSFPNETHWPICQKSRQFKGGSPTKFDDILCRVHNLADNEFIAHSRQDIPDLLAEVERLKYDLRMIRHATKPIKGHFCPEWDDMFITKYSVAEFDCCLCFKKEPADE